MLTLRSSFIGECWQKMRIMKTEFEQSESGDGLPSRKAVEERVRDEQASARMNAEGYPNAGQHRDPRKHTIAFAMKNKSR